MIIIKQDIIPIKDKTILSVKEASALFGIGQHRLREILRDDDECRYHFMIGRIIRIKKAEFENFLKNVEQV